MLTPHDKLGPYSLRAPTGQYNLLGNTIFTDGDLLLTITKCLTAQFVLTAPLPRLRGRGWERGYASQCIVFTELDFEVLDDACV